MRTRAQRVSSKHEAEMRMAVHYAVATSMALQARRLLRRLSDVPDEEESREPHVGLDHLLLGLLVANRDRRLRWRLRSVGLSPRKLRRALRDRERPESWSPDPGPFAIDIPAVAARMGLSGLMLGSATPVADQAWRVIQEAGRSSAGLRGPLGFRALLLAVLAEEEGPVVEILRSMGVDRLAAHRAVSR